MPGVGLPPIMMGMVQVRCVDGSVLTVQPVAVLDRDGAPYEATLRLLVDGEPFGEVGQRCAFFLDRAAQALRSAGEDGPVSTLEAGVRRWAVDAELDAGQVWHAAARFLPRDRELFAFLSRDPDDLPGHGELRARLCWERTWVPGVAGARGHWRLGRRAVLEAWGGKGRGVRAELDEVALLPVLDALVAEVVALGHGLP